MENKKRLKKNIIRKDSRDRDKYFVDFLNIA